jgi:hypothetical protein
MTRERAGARENQNESQSVYELWSTRHTRRWRRGSDTSCAQNHAQIVEDCSRRATAALALTENYFSVNTRKGGSLWGYEKVICGELLVNKQINK